MRSCGAPLYQYYSFFSFIPKWREDESIIFSVVEKEPEDVWDGSYESFHDHHEDGARGNGHQQKREHVVTEITWRKTKEKERNWETDYNI